MVGLALTSQLMSWGFFFSLTYFFGPMTADLGWSSTEFSTVNLISTMTFAVLTPIVGRYVDLHGGRGLMMIGGVIGAVGIAAMAYVQEAWQFYLLMGVWVPVAMSFYGIMVTGVALANWFNKKRGRAFAIASMGTSAGGVTFGPLTSYLVLTIGWRETWLVLSLIVAAGVALPAFLFMSRRPEDVGLRPDGEAPVFDGKGMPAAATVGPAVGEHVWTRGQAMRTPAFWLIVVSFAMSNLVISAFLLHLIPYLRSSGFDAGQSTIVAVVFSSALLLCKPVFGVLLERFAPRKVSFYSFAVSGIAIFVLVLAPSPAFLIVGTLLYGISMGGAIPMEDVTWASYFGRWTIGRIRGAGYPIESIIGALGPMIGGIAFDTTGGYTGAFVIFAAAYLVAGMAILTARPPHPRLGTTMARPVPLAPRLAAAPGGTAAYGWLSTRIPVAVDGAGRRLASGVRRPLVGRNLPLILAGLAGVALGMLVNLLTLPNRHGPPGRSGRSHD